MDFPGVPYDQPAIGSSEPRRDARLEQKCHHEKQTSGVLYRHRPDCYRHGSNALLSDMSGWAKHRYARCVPYSQPGIADTPQSARIPKSKRRTVDFPLNHFRCAGCTLQINSGSPPRRPCPPKDEVNRIAKLAFGRAPDQQTFALDSTIARANPAGPQKLPN